MSDYRIFEANEFLSQLAELTKGDREFISKKLASYVHPQLRVEPHYGPNIKKLWDYMPETWRYRIGKYRVFYLIHDADRMVFILTLDLRKDAYRQVIKGIKY